jgi:HAD superfamily hydrolase (TIGR01457 family)
MRIADRYDCFLLDLDGVLFRGDEPVPHAADTVEALRSLRKRLAFVTNNSTRTPPEVADMLNGSGIRAGPAEVVTSALATADLLAERGVRSAFVVGERGIREALGGVGIRVVEEDVGEVDAVVVGLDRSTTYDKLRTASLLVERGATLIATNGDASYPAPDGRWPGAGALLALVTTTTEAEAEVVGKPNPPLFIAARERAGGGNPLVVGDRLETDVAGAIALGWDSFLVLSGIAGRGDLARSSVQPTYVANDVSALLGDT